MRAAYAILCVLQLIRWLRIRVRRIRKIGHDVKLVVQPRSSITRFGSVVYFCFSKKIIEEKKRKEGKKKKQR